MALIKATRAGEMAQKKDVSVLVVEVNDNMLAEAGAAIASNDFLVAKLPANALVLRAHTAVLVASDAATSAAAKVGTAQGGAQLVASTDIKAVAVADATVAPLSTGSGMDVYLNLALAGAVTTVGRTVVTIEYIEFTKNTGEYTRYE